MPNFQRIANWGAVQSETGPVTAQVLRRILGSSGNGRGGILESAVMNIYRTTNIQGGPGAFPLRVIGSPPPQIIIGYNDATLWNHGVQSNGDYNIDRGGFVHFQLAADGKLCLNEATANAHLNINVGGQLTPDQIDNIYLWLVGDDIDGANGQTITNWRDRVGPGDGWQYQDGTGEEPNLAKPARNGHAAARVVKADPDLTASIVPSVDAQGSFTLVVVYKNPTTGFCYTLGGGNGSNNNGYRAPNGFDGAVAKIWFDTSEQSISDAISGGAPGWNIDVIRREYGATGTISYYHNNVDTTTTGDKTNTGAVYFGKVFALRGTGANSGDDAHLAEAIIYKSDSDNDGYISDDEMYQLYTHLAIKYGFSSGSTVGGPSAPPIQIQDGTGAILTEFNESGYLRIGDENPIAPLHVGSALQAYSAGNSKVLVNANQIELSMMTTNGLGIGSGIFFNRNGGEAFMAFARDNIIKQQIRLGGAAEYISITSNAAGDDYRFNVLGTGEVCIGATSTPAGITPQLYVQQSYLTGPQLALSHLGTSHVKFTEAGGSITIASSESYNTRANFTDLMLTVYRSNTSNIVPMLTLDRATSISNNHDFWTCMENSTDIWIRVDDQGRLATGETTNNELVRPLSFKSHRIYESGTLSPASTAFAFFAPAAASCLNHITGYEGGTKTWQIRWDGSLYRNLDLQNQRAIYVIESSSEPALTTGRDDLMLWYRPYNPAGADVWEKASQFALKMEDSAGNWVWRVLLSGHTVG